MTTTKQRPEALAWRVFRGSVAVRRGLLTSRALRAGPWKRLRYDVYADARLEEDHRLACQAAALTLPKDAVLAGRSAAYLHGVDHAASFGDPVHVIVPPGSAFVVRAGLSVHRTRIDRNQIEPSPDGPRTTALRTAWDVAAWHDLVVAVSIVDSLLGAGLVDPAALRQWAAAGPALRGSALARRAFALADGRAQSPPESQLRVRFALAGLPAALPQCPIAVAGGLVLHADLGWPEFRIAVEYDGMWHAGADQFHRDRRRQNLLQGAGWIVLYATSDRMRRDFPSLINEIREVLLRRGWRP